jgi:hypothetical protein
MLVEKLKAASNDLGFLFDYGKEHWQNLADLPNEDDKPPQDRTVYLLLLYKDRKVVTNSYNSIEYREYTGEMLLCVRSQITDPDYNFKYENRIELLEQRSEDLLEALGGLCEGWTIKLWSESEVENLYDTNVDGLKIRYTITDEK